MNAPAAGPLIDLLRQARVVAALRAFMPAARVLFDAEDTRPYECDGLTAYRQRPLAVALPETDLMGALASAPAQRISFDVAIAAPDGAALQLEVSASAVLADGQQLVFAVCRDVTQRKRAEAALRESEARHRATFENSAVGMAEHALDGRWLNVNPRLCEITGYSRAALMALDFRQLTHPDDRRDEWPQLRRLLRDVDTVSRVGEARFGLVLEGVTSRASVTDRAARLIAAGLMPLKGLKPEVTLQFHIAAVLLDERCVDAPELAAALSDLLKSMSPRTRRPIRFLEPEATQRMPLEGITSMMDNDSELPRADGAP